MPTRVTLVAAVVSLLLSACTIDLSELAPPTSAPGPAAPDTTSADRAPDTTLGEAPEQPDPLVGVDLYDVSELVDRVQDGVVAITVTQVGFDVFNRPFEQEGAGTGIVINDQGHILTNAHVVQAASEVIIYSADGTERPALVVATRPDRDLALVRVDDAEGLEPLPLGDSQALDVGDPVVAIGNALGLGNEPTVSVGIVSAKDRALPTPAGDRLQGLIQTDAAINPGNSGGPLLNSAGQVVGINTAIIQGAQNVGFAISIDSARPVIEGMLSGTGEAFLGVSVVDNDPQTASQLGLSVSTGAIVVEVQANSPAVHAGLQTGDVIVAVQGAEVEGAQGLIDELARFEPGDTVSLEVVRGEQTVELEATLTAR